MRKERNKLINHIPNRLINKIQRQDISKFCLSLLILTNRIRKRHQKLRKYFIIFCYFQFGRAL